jgi:hypothetical protein
MDDPLDYLTELPMPAFACSAVYYPAATTATGTVEVSYYLGEVGQADGTRLEQRSEYLTFALEASCLKQKRAITATGVR